MKKVICIFTSIIILILGIIYFLKIQIDNRSYIYKGESENWIANCRMSSTSLFYETSGITHYSGLNDGELVITYKNDISQLSKVKDMIIAYEDSSGGGKIHENFEDGSPDQKSYKFKDVGGAVARKDEVIKVNINIDGKVESFELKKDN